jgi:hypothetical protein
MGLERVTRNPPPRENQHPAPALCGGFCFYLPGPSWPSHLRVISAASCCQA